MHGGDICQFTGTWSYFKNNFFWPDNYDHTIENLFMMEIKCDVI